MTMNHSNSFDMVIIGGGVSGLSLAHYLAQSGKKTLVLEARDGFGGCVRTARFSNQKFWMEMGAHTCYNSYSKLIDVVLGNDLEGNMVAREKLGLKVFNGQLGGMFSHVNKFELLRSVPRLFFEKKEGQSVETFYSKVLGKKNYKHLFSRLFTAVIGQEADEYAADLFLKRRSTRRKEYPKSFTFSKGMQELLDRIVGNELVTLKSGTPVTSLSREGMEFVLQTEQGERYVTKDLALAVPPTVAGRLIQELSTELADYLLQIPVHDIESRGVVLPKETVNLERLSFIIPLEGSCYSVVTRDVVDHPELRGFAFHFKGGMLSEQEQKEMIEKVLGVEYEQMVEVVTADHKLPLLKAGHSERVRKMEVLLEQSGLYLTGNYFDGMSLEDCISRSHKEFERYLKNN